MNIKAKFTFSILTFVCGITLNTDAATNTTSYFAEYLGNWSYRVPFVMKTEDKSVRYYRASYMAMRIEKVVVDGEELKEYGEVLLDDFDPGFLTFSEDQHVFNELYLSLTSVTEIYKNGGWTAVSYELPQKFNSAEIYYRIRTSGGLSDDIYVTALKTDRVGNNNQTSNQSMEPTRNTPAESGND